MHRIHTMCTIYQMVRVYPFVIKFREGNRSLLRFDFCTLLLINFVDKNIDFHKHPQPPYECADFVLFDRQSNYKDGVLGISTISKSMADNLRAKPPQWFALLETTILLADTSQIAMSRTPFELFIYLFSAFLWLLDLFVLYFFLSIRW